MQKLKIGLDVHGVVDTFPSIFSALSKTLLSCGHEVHIVTGLKETIEVRQELVRHGIIYSHYFSIVDYLESRGIPIEWRNGLPYADKTAWDLAKKEYCDTVGMTLMIDDSPVYKETFHDIDTVYLHLINNNRKIYETR